MEGKRPSFIKMMGKRQRLNRPSHWQPLWGKGVGNFCSEREEDLTILLGDAGAMPRMGCYLVIGEDVRTAVPAHLTVALGPSKGWKRMSEGIVIALIGFAGAILGAAIAGFATLTAAGTKGKSNESISCSLIGLFASIGAAGGFVIGGFFGASLMQQSPQVPPLSPTQQPFPQTISGYIPGSSEEAAILFGGPPAEAWKQCPGEPINCWTFSLPGTSYRLSVPENCLRPDGSIDGWKYQGGYPGQPDETQGTTKIWNSIGAATIRCR